MKALYGNNVRPHVSSMRLHDSFGAYTKFSGKCNFNAYWSAITSALNETQIKLTTLLRSHSLYKMLLSKYRTRAHPDLHTGCGTFLKGLWEHLTTWKENNFWLCAVNLASYLQYRNIKTNEGWKSQRKHLEIICTPYVFGLVYNLSTIANLLSSWSRTLLEKLPVAYLVTKIPTFYETHTFITLFTINRHRLLS
jgi:hypothetical protein